MSENKTNLPPNTVTHTFVRNAKFLKPVHRAILQMIGSHVKNVSLINVKNEDGSIKKEVNQNTFARDLNISSRTLRRYVKDLVDWGIVRKIHTFGKRVIYWVTEPTILSQILDNFYRKGKEGLKSFGEMVGLLNLKKKRKSRGLVHVRTIVAEPTKESKYNYNNKKKEDQNTDDFVHAHSNESFRSSRKNQDLSKSRFAALAFLMADKAASV